MLTNTKDWKYINVHSMASKTNQFSTAITASHNRGAFPRAFRGLTTFIVPFLGVPGVKKAYKPFTFVVLLNSITGLEIMESLSKRCIIFDTIFDSFLADLMEVVENELVPFLSRKHRRIFNQVITCHGHLRISMKTWV